MMTAAKQVRLETGSQTTATTADGGTGNINIYAENVTIRESLHADGEMEVLSQKSIIATKDVSADGDMTLRSENNALSIGGQAQSGGDMELYAGTYVSLGSDAVSGGEMSVTTIDDDTFAMGDLLAQNDLTLNTNLYLGGQDDQAIESTDGRVTAHGFIHKVEPGQLFITGGDSELSVDLKYDGPEWGVSNRGNVYISGQGDIQLSGDLTGIGGTPYVVSEGEGQYRYAIGGVSVISENGAIYTEGSDAINVTIKGYSKDLDFIEYSFFAENAGVDLPFNGSEGESLGKAAIVLQSKEDLILGPDAALQAHGTFLPASEELQYVIAPDDRPGVNFLAEDAVIGGFDRDQGEPVDVAIYVGSTGGGQTPGNVTVQTSDISVTEYCTEGPATVVFDAYDTVSMPFLAGLVNGESKFGGFRLEVVSRMCEWLSDAVDGGKLPYADNPEFVEGILGEGNYVLRGAGQNNGAIGSGERAWVLENLPAEPVAAPLAVLEIPELKGCPVEMDAAAIELGIPSDTLQMTIRNALAMNPNIQPCDACASLVTAATILNDADGVRLVAMNQVFNTLAPADAPFTPEVSASIVTAFAQMGDQDRQYALAAEYVDAFVRYVAILDTELKAPVGDPVAFALEKHGDPLMGDGVNPNIAAYILSQVVPEGI